MEFPRNRTWSRNRGDKWFTEWVLSEKQEGGKQDRTGRKAKQGSNLTWKPAVTCPWEVLKHELYPSELAPPFVPQWQSVLGCELRGGWPGGGGVTLTAPGSKCTRPIKGSTKNINSIHYNSPTYSKYWTDSYKTLWCSPSWQNHTYSYSLKSSSTTLPPFHSTLATLAWNLAYSCLDPLHCSGASSGMTPPSPPPHLGSWWLDPSDSHQDFTH